MLQPGLDPASLPDEKAAHPCYDNGSVRNTFTCRPVAARRTPATPVPSRLAARRNVRASPIPAAALRADTRAQSPLGIRPTCYKHRSINDAPRPVSSLPDRRVPPKASSASFSARRPRFSTPFLPPPTPASSPLSSPFSLRLSPAPKGPCQTNTRPSAVAASTPQSCTRFCKSFAATPRASPRAASDRPLFRIDYDCEGFR